MICLHLHLHPSGGTYFKGKANLPSPEVYATPQVTAWLVEKFSHQHGRA